MTAKPKLSDTSKVDRSVAVSECSHLLVKKLGEATTKAAQGCGGDRRRHGAAPPTLGRATEDADLSVAGTQNPQ